MLKKRNLYFLAIILITVLTLIFVNFSSVGKFNHPDEDKDFSDIIDDKINDEIVDDDITENDQIEDPIDDPVEKEAIDYTVYKEGQVLGFSQDFTVYQTDRNAISQVNSTAKYKAGNYFVYAIANNAINVSRTQNKPGGWLDLNHLDPTEFKLVSDVVVDNSKPEEPKPEPKPQEPKPIVKGYSWSFAYPQDSGKDVLESNNGVYKKYDVGKIIYLTFDNGYEYENLTASILNTLANNNIKAVFFVTGQYIKTNPGFVKQMVQEGHIVGNHSQDHKNHAQVSAQETKDDLLRWEESFKKYIGDLPTTKLYRPPGGNFSKESLVIAKDLGYKTVLWAYAYNDWNTDNQPEVSTSLEKLLNSNSDGNVVLLHSVSKTNTLLLDDYIKGTINAGYQFELLK